MSTNNLALGNLFDVSGKVVVVTGGGSGLGRAIAQGFATNGAKVFITGRRRELLDSVASESNGKIIAIQGDVATKEGCVAAAAAISQRTNHVDVLVNNAGVLIPFRKKLRAHPNDPDAVQEQLESITDEDFLKTNAVNVSAVYFMTVALLPLLRKSSDGSVIVISSIASQMVQRATGSVTYGASKAAALQLGNILAGRLTPFKIRVNTICPGIFPSEMTSKPGDASYTLDRATYKTTLRSPMARPGRFEEIVGPVIMLASKAGGFMTGSSMVIDGGRLMAAGLDDGIQCPDECYVWSPTSKL